MKVHVRKMSKLKTGRKYLLAFLILIFLTVAYLLFRLAMLETCDSASRVYIDSTEKNGNVYYLYGYQVGFQDKVYYYELYDSPPIFSKCGEPIDKVFYSIHYDDYPSYPNKTDVNYIKSIALQLNQDEKLKINYSKDINEDVGFYKIKFNEVNNNE